MENGGSWGGPGLMYGEEGGILGCTGIGGSDLRDSSSGNGYEFINQSTRPPPPDSTRR